jgi:N-formylmaleamate deformylase
MKKQQPGFWTHFAISLTIVGGMLAGNFSSKVLLQGASGAMQNDSERAPAKTLYQQQIATIANATLEFNHEARHFIMLDQPDWLTRRIASALQE